MIYPKLVRDRICTTPIEVTLNGEGLSKDGGPITVFRATLKCNFQDTAKTVFSHDGKQVQLSGIALFSHDFCPEVPNPGNGIVVIHGVKRTIYQSTKARNPDGTVNYIELRLI